MCKCPGCAFLCYDVNTLQLHIRDFHPDAALAVDDFVLDPPAEAENPPAEAENPPAEAENPPAEAENPPAEAENPTAEVENPRAAEGNFNDCDK
jgi:hypothetical protein